MIRATIETRGRKPGGHNDPATCERMRVSMKASHLKLSRRPTSCERCGINIKKKEIVRFKGENLCGDCLNVDMEPIWFDDYAMANPGRFEYGGSDGCCRMTATGVATRTGYVHSVGRAGQLETNYKTKQWMVENRTDLRRIFFYGFQWTRKTVCAWLSENEIKINRLFYSIYKNCWVLYVGGSGDLKCREDPGVISNIYRSEKLGRGIVGLVKVGNKYKYPEQTDCGEF